MTDHQMIPIILWDIKHVVHRILPQPQNVQCNLRQLTHNLTLPTDVNAVIKQNFI